MTDANMMAFFFDLFAGAFASFSFEFDKFGSVVEAAQQRLEQANNELDKLVGVRTRQIQRKLANVTSLSDGEATALLESSDTPME